MADGTQVNAKVAGWEKWGPSVRAFAVETKNLILNYPDPDDPIVRQKRDEAVAKAKTAALSSSPPAPRIRRSAVDKFLDIFDGLSLESNQD